MDALSRQWYVLNAVGSLKQLELSLEALAAMRAHRGDEPLETFLPTCVEQTTMFGKPRMRRRKLLGNYLFVRGNYTDLLDLTRTIPAMRLLPHPDNSDEQERRWMTISDRDMAVFKVIAAAHANKLPCYPMEAVDVDDGDKVEIVGGEFDGVTGTLQCRQGHNGGMVLIAVGNQFLVPTLEIQPQYIRILQFGKGNRHPYRIFEAHLTRAIQALKHLLAAPGAGLTTEDVAAMSVFTGRFEALVPATVNIASQHAALMLMSYSALQDEAMAHQWLQRCQELLPSIKSDTQRAWQLAFTYASTGDDEVCRQARSIIDGWTVAANDRKRAIVLTSLADFSALWQARGHHPANTVQ